MVRPAAARTEGGYAEHAENCNFMVTARALTGQVINPHYAVLGDLRETPAVLAAEGRTMQLSLQLTN